MLASPLILSKPTPNKTLYLYLSIVNETVSLVLTREDSEGQKPICFVSKALKGAK